MEKIRIRSIAVPGLFKHQSIRVGKVFFCKSICLKNYAQIIKSQVVVCENSQKTSHIIVVCRIMGIPVVEIDSVDNLQYKDKGKFININYAQKNLCVTDIIQDSGLERLEFHQPIQHELKYQLSIINSPSLIKKINQKKSNNVEQLFLRSELLWLSLQGNPYDYLNEHGEKKTALVISNELRKLCKFLKQDQIFNFRGLDLRSDEDFFSEENFIEPNPQLGLHGTRQLLSRSEYLKAELTAIDMLYNEGITNLVYSLPFVTNKKEVDDALIFCKKYCINQIKIGIFIETPAAIIELPMMLEEITPYVYLGTKDLAQFILAVDRGNNAVSHLMDITGYPVICSIKNAVDACEKKEVYLYIFSMPADLSKLLSDIPNIKRLSLAAADYLLIAEG